MGLQTFHANQSVTATTYVTFCGGGRRQSVPQSGSGDRKSSIVDGWKTGASEDKSNSYQSRRLWSNNILHTIVMTQSILQAGKCFRPTNVFSEQRRSIPIRIFSSKLSNNFDEKLTFLLLTLYRARQQKYIPVRLCLQFYQQSLGISKRNFADMDMKIEIGFISCGRLVCKWKPLPWKIKNKI